jgi:spore maturation protein CgeB
MKILYVDLYYDYGKKSRGPNIIGLHGFKKSFEKLGHEVVTFFYDDYLSNTTQLQKALMEKANTCKPDLIFFILFRNQFKFKTLDYLKSKYITFNWFGDDQWRFDSFTKNYAPHFTWCSTTDKFAIEKYHNIGQNNVILTQWAAIDNHSIYNSSKNYDYDISFVGGYHPYRKWFLSKLKKRGIVVNTFGNNWENGSLASAEMNKLFAKTKINLNISNSTTLDTSISYLFSSPRAIPQTVVSGKIKSQIKARNFEIPYFGGFQITDYVPTLENYFDIGKEIICYSNVDEAADLISYYLNNDAEREKIKNAGHHRAASEHGYINRLKIILEHIK